jgi:hypothetical protein
MSGITIIEGLSACAKVGMLSASIKDNNNKFFFIFI